MKKLISLLLIMFFLVGCKKNISSEEARDLFINSKSQILLESDTILNHKILKYKLDSTEISLYIYNDTIFKIK